MRVRTSARILVPVVRLWVYHGLGASCFMQLCRSSIESSEFVLRVSAPFVCLPSPTTLPEKPRKDQEEVEKSRAGSESYDEW